MMSTGGEGRASPAKCPLKNVCMYLYQRFKDDSSYGRVVGVTFKQHLTSRLTKHNIHHWSTDQHVTGH